MNGPSTQVFLAINPFQLLNCLEAQREYDGLGLASAFVVHRQKKPESQRQLEAVLSRFSPEGLIWVDDELPALGIVSEVRRNLPSDRQSTQVFAGTHRLLHHREVIRRLSSLRPVMVDDGTETLLMAQRRSGLTWRFTNGYKQRLARLGRRARYPYPEILRDIVHPSMREFGSIEFFSIYRVAGNRRDAWRQNQLVLLRECRRPDRERQAPVLIGSSLVESGLMTEEDYSDLIGTIVDEMGGRPKYFAHRNEKDDRLARLANRCGLEIVRPWAPIELVCVEEGIVPAPLHAIMSTAVDTLSIIFPGLSVVEHLPDLERVHPHGRQQFAKMMDAQIRAREAADRGADSNDSGA